MYEKLKKYKAIDLFKDKRITTVASSWVYYFLTALLPIVFLLVTAFNVFSVDLVEEIVFRLPEAFRPAGEIIVSTAQNASGGVTAFFIVSLVFSGSTLFNQKSKDGDYLYGVSGERKVGFMRRLFSVTALCVLFLIFLGLAFLITFQNLVFSSLNVRVEQTNLISSVGVGTVVLVSFILIVLLGKFISPVKRGFFDLAIGSLISLFIIVLGTIGFIFYLRIFKNLNAFYGSLVGVIVFLIWAYIVMLGLVVGTAFNVKRYKNSIVRLKRRELSGKNPVTMA